LECPGLQKTVVGVVGKKCAESLQELRVRFTCRI